MHFVAIPNCLFVYYISLPAAETKYMMKINNK